MSQPAAARRKRPAPSAPAKLELVRPTLTAQEELFPQIARELPPLFLRHYEELSDKAFPLAPDWDRYYALGLTGNLKITTARFGNVLAGYIFNIICRHLHYAEPHADMEMFWLDPVYRGGLFALRWFRFNDDMLREAGVRKVSAAIKTGYRDGRVELIFQRLKYRNVEKIYSKVL